MELSHNDLLTKALILPPSRDTDVIGDVRSSQHVVYKAKTILKYGRKEETMKHAYYEPHKPGVSPAVSARSRTKHQSIRKDVSRLNGNNEVEEGV